MSSKCSRRFSNASTIRKKSVNTNAVAELDLRPIEESDVPMNDTDYGLPYFPASMFAAILEDAITEIRILDECNNDLRIRKLYTDMPLLLMYKFDVEQSNLDNDDDGIYKDVDSIDRKFQKLDADRKYFEEVCLDAYKDLSINNCYQGLARHVTTKNDLDHYRIDLNETEARNRQLRKELRKQLRQLGNHVKSVSYETNATIENLKTEIENYALVQEITSRYVDGWQRARSEQHSRSIYNAEFVPIRSVDYYKQRNEHEHRVHAEIEMFTNIEIHQTLEKIETWMVKYDADLEALELKTQIQKNKYQDACAKRRSLEETLQNHEMMMNEWIAFKEARAAACAYRTMMNKSAIIVQAWWRGMLVRRKLGPYQERKKKKK